MAIIVLLALSAAVAVAAAAENGGGGAGRETEWSSSAKKIGLKHGQLGLSRHVSSQYIPTCSTQIDERG